MRLGLAGSVDLDLGIGDLAIESRQLGGPFALDLGRLCPAWEFVKLNGAPSLEEEIVLLEDQSQNILGLLGDRSGAGRQVPAFGQVFAACFCRRLAIDAQFLSAIGQTRDL